MKTIVCGLLDRRKMFFGKRGFHAPLARLLKRGDEPSSAGFRGGFAFNRKGGLRFFPEEILKCPSEKFGVTGRGNGRADFCAPVRSEGRLGLGCAFNRGAIDAVTEEVIFDFPTGAPLGEAGYHLGGVEEWDVVAGDCFGIVQGKFGASKKLVERS